MFKIKEKLSALYRKIVGENATPEYIARGWAIGMFWGCICPFGLQLLLSIPSAFILKGSKIGATVGTFITNHFTIFLIYPAQCYAGSLILGNGLSYVAIKEAMVEVLKQQNYSSLMAAGMDLTLSFFVGGAILAAVMTPLTYFGVKAMVNRERARRAVKA